MMNYRGTPLFGEDSSPRNTSEFFALAGTLFFWLIFAVCMIFIRPRPQKPKFKEVQIVLASTPLAEKTEANPAPAAAASAPAPAASPAQETIPVTEAPAAPAPVVEKPAPVQKSEPKPVAKPKAAEPKMPEPKKTETAQKPKAAEAAKATPVPKPAPAPAPVAEAEPIEYAVDPMEAFNQQTKKQPKQEFNWDMFDDEAAEVSTSAAQSSQVVNNTTAFEGVAGTTTQNTSTALASQSSSSSASQNNSVSQSTSSALSGITNARYVGRAVNGVSSETSVKTKASGSGNVALEMSNGNMRALLKPATPAINLSTEAAATIDGSRTVTIRFRVVEAGNVPRAEISIEPESTLHQLVRDEIRDQVSSWLFESADYSAYATFTYKIVKQ